MDDNASCASDDDVIWWPSGVQTTTTTAASGGRPVDDVQSSAMTTLVIKCAFYAAISVIGGFGSVLTLVAIRTTPRLWTTSNLLIGNVAATDFCLCFVTLPMYIVTQLYVYAFHQRPCDFQTLIGVVFAVSKLSPQVHLCNLIPLAFDRYVAIVHPFIYYESFATEKVTVFAIVMPWVYGVSVVIASFVWFRSAAWKSCVAPYSYTMNAIIDTGIYACVSLTTVFVYGRILQIALHQRRKISVEGNQRPHDDPPPATADQNPAATEQRIMTKSRRRQEFKAARVTAVVVISVVLFWMPFNVARVMQASGLTGVVYVQSLQDIGGSLGLSNAAFDWIIYGAVNRHFRLAFARILGIKLKPQTNDHSV